MIPTIPVIVVAVWAIPTPVIAVVPRTIIVIVAIAVPVHPLQRCGLARHLAATVDTRQRRSLRTSCHQAQSQHSRCHHEPGCVSLPSLPLCLGASAAARPMLRRIPPRTTQT